MSLIFINNNFYRFEDRCPIINKKIATDDEFAYQYVKNILKLPNDFTFKRAEVYSEKIIEKKNDIEPPLESSNVDEEVDGEKWSIPATEYFITLRIAWDDKFTSGIEPKKKLWTKISQELKSKGFNIEADSCSTKFKGMLVTYRRNLKKKLTGGESGITWPFFKIMDELYGNQVNNVQDNNQSENRSISSSPILQNSETINSILQPPVTSSPSIVSTTSLTLSNVLSSIATTIGQPSPPLESTLNNENLETDKIFIKRRKLDHEHQTHEDAVIERQFAINEERNQLLRERNDILRDLVSKVDMLVKHLVPNNDESTSTKNGS